MKKIVLLSERLPYPPTSGTKNLLYNYCKILHEKLNLEVINISFLEQDENISAKPDFISRVYTMPNPSGKTKIRNIILMKRESSKTAGRRSREIIISSRSATAVMPPW